MAIAGFHWARFEYPRMVRYIDVNSTAWRVEVRPLPHASFDSTERPRLPLPATPPLIPPLYHHSHAHFVLQYGLKQQYSRSHDLPLAVPSTTAHISPMARSRTASPSGEEHYASYLPRDIPYSHTFEDACSTLLLSSITDKTLSLPDPETSFLPRLDVPDLPLPPNDPRRLFTSPVPGLRLTHPGGYLEGGPGLNAAEDEFGRHFCIEQGVRDARQLASAIARETARQMDIARGRARARRAAQERNERIKAEIKTAVDQMELETRVLTKARERARERRERKEKRRTG